MTVVEVPLISQNQKFAVTLAGVEYHATVRWCPPFGTWILDLDTSDDVPILSGLPLITGVDLLAQYGYLNFGGELIVQTDYDAFAPPTFDNLGTLSHLYFATTP